MMRPRSFFFLVIFTPVAAYAQLTLNLARTTVNVVSTVFLNPPSQANGVQGDNNIYSLNLDGATTYNQSYMSSSAQGSGTSTITEAFTSTVSASSTQILGNLDIASSSMSWASSAAEVPYASAGTTLTITFTAATAFTYNIGLISTGGVTNNSAFTAATHSLNFRNLTTSQNLYNDFNMTTGSYINTLPAGQYRIIISSSYGAPILADADGTAARTFSASVNITAVPEASTTALWSALVILGVTSARKLGCRARSV